MNQKKTWESWMGKNQILEAAEDTIIRQLVFFEKQKPTPIARVLDIGCGHGNNSAWLAGRGYEVVSFDISASCVERTRNRTLGLSNIFVHEWDITRGIPESWGRFDLAIDVRTLQHVTFKEVQHVFQDLRTHLNDGGAYIGMLISREMETYPYYAATCDCIEPGTLVMQGKYGPVGGLEGAGQTHFFSRQELEYIAEPFSHVEILEYGYELPRYEVANRISGYDGRYFRRYWVMIAIK